MTRPAALPFLLNNGAAGLVVGLAYKGLGPGGEHAILFILLAHSATAEAIPLSMPDHPPPVAS
ncbi:hypothetical protein HUS73_24490, partial [Pandoraea nosoerga]|uniref:hypothetical protein n=1 Tax=Pandoraea nosoerga TaxID=2508296 RepID=UPI00197E321F